MPVYRTIILGEQLNYSVHTSRTNHEFAKKILKYNLPHVVKNIPDLVMHKIVTHSLKGFSSYDSTLHVKKIKFHMHYFKLPYMPTTLNKL